MKKNDPVRSFALLVDRRQKKGGCDRVCECGEGDVSGTKKAEGK